MSERLASFALPSARAVRIGAAALAVASLLVLGVARDDAVVSRLAVMALLAATIATVVGIGESVASPRTWAQTAAARVAGFRPWQAAYALVGLGAALAAQTWFVAGTSIAGGDIAPPDGTAWLGHIFEPWTWMNPTLGSPGALERQLPWAAVLGTVHALGGSAEVAQRVWLTVLFVGAGVAAVALLRSLGLRPATAACGAAVYLFNAHTLSVVPNDAYLAALVVLPWLPSCVINAASGRLRIRSAGFLMGLAAPLVGVAALNPPLLLLLGAAAGLSPLLVYWLGGRDAAVRALRAAGVGIALVVLLSAYWLVPTAIASTQAAAGQLSSLASWTWTEQRATVANAFWLQTSWGWNFPEYNLYAVKYSQQPLALLKYALPALAFAALGLARRPSPPRADANRTELGPSHLRLVAATSAAVLFLIVLSTGTNPPGSVIFLPLYNLPLGWLLREPDRFLLAAPLAYAVLAAVTIELLPFPSWASRTRSFFRELTVPAGAWLRQRRQLVIGGAAVLTASLASGYPLLTGAAVSGPTSSLPSRHAQVPGYWYDMSAYADALTDQGSVIALPEDVFYQVPFTWGYYGIDSFMTHLMSRHIIDPVQQGYVTSGDELYSTIGLFQRAALSRDWRMVRALSQALDAPLILVRGDVAPDGALGQGLASASALSQALSADPDFRLVHSSGPLELFRMRGYSTAEVTVTSGYATVNDRQPDLSVMGVLPGGTQLVNSPPQPGVAQVVEAPPVDTWTEQPGFLATRLEAPAGWRYSVASLADEPRATTIGGPLLADGPPAQVGGTSVSLLGQDATLRAPATTVIEDGDFRRGLWSRPGDCNDVSGPRDSGINAVASSSAGPDGTPALVLSARRDAACEFQRLRWSGGPLVVSLDAKHVAGADPRLCIWEVPIGKCASTPPLTSTRAWSSDRFLVQPDQGATTLEVFLYSDGPGSAPISINEYSGVKVLELSALPRIDLIGEPVTSAGAASARASSTGSARGGASAPSLTVLHEGYDAGWTGAPGHVIVDGLFNGWIGATPRQTSAIVYEPAAAIGVAQLISLLTANGLLVLVAAPVLWGAKQHARRMARSRFLR